MVRARISFPGGVAVNAELGGHAIRTDQPERSGGAGSAPAPFDLFLASIGTCAGFYALRFCQQRSIDTAGLEVALEATPDPENKRIGRITLEVELPPRFPEKYRDAIIRAMNQCSVKRHILEPPEIEVRVAAPVAA